MGTKIFEIIQGKEITIEDLKGKTLAIDSYNMLYQFLSSIRQRDGNLLMDSKGRVTSHLTGLFTRTANFLQKGLKPIFVFDGKTPELKQKELKTREKIKQEAAEKLEKAETDEEKRKYASMTSKLTRDMVDEAKELIKALGCPIIQAPSEGEAQCAALVKNKDAYAVVSQDADSLLFGASNLIRNLSITRKRKLPGKQTYATIKPELIELDKALNSLGIDKTQLITLAMLVGTDYNPKGIKNIGPKKALKLVKQYKTDMDELFRDVKWGDYFDYSWQEVFYLIKKIPTTKKYKIEWSLPKTEKIKKILIDEHNFSEDRVNSSLSKLSKIQEKQKQKALGRWF